MKYIFGYIKKEIERERETKEEGTCITRFGLVCVSTDSIAYNSYIVYCIELNYLFFLRFSSFFNSREIVVLVFNPYLQVR